MKTKHLLNNLLVGIGLLMVVTITAQAEDSEIFSTSKNPDPPNVLFVLDTSGSMKITVPGTDGKSRMQVLQESLNQVLSQEYKALNVGIMDFSRGTSGGIDFPVSDINGDANDIDPDIPKGTSVREVLKSILDHYNPEDETPLGVALYNAARYFLGSKISSYGYYGNPYEWDVEKKAYTNGHYRSANPASYEGGTWFEKLAGSEHFHYDTCYKNKSASDGKSCFNPSVDSYTCEIEKGKPAKPIEWGMRKTTCDSTGFECSNSWSGPYFEEPVAPDDGNSYYIYSNGPYPATKDKEVCTGAYVRFDSGFDTRPTYKSPIIGQCQANYLVLLGDGEPTRSYPYDLAKKVYGKSYDSCENLDAFGSPIDKHGLCAPDLTKYMSEVDLAPNLLGKQTVTTYTVGFSLDGAAKAQQYLKLLSDDQHGKGEYFDAGSPDELTAVFQNIIDNVIDEDRSFVGPAVSVARNNRLATNQYVYQTSFVPSKNPSWEGEVTRYKVGKSGYDRSSRLNLSATLSNARTVYTYTGNLPITGDVDLTQGIHGVVDSNDKLTFDLLGLKAGNESIRTDILRWARGIDRNDADKDGDTTEAHQHLGDSLHSKPAVISYANGMDVLYITTNDGYLHAFNISTNTTPTEIFSFIPQAMLKNLKTAYSNLSTDNKMYGLDGDMTVWQSGSNVTIYFGMRRGGRNYYSLDVSNPKKPKLKWIIQGGVPGSEFEELGQSWSTPQLTKVSVNGTEKMALIFSGGYDILEDSVDIRVDDTMGRAVFIVDADTGKLLWSAGPDETHKLTLTGMKNSIPSDIRTIDFDGDGLTDRLYFGDTGGRVWRIDLDSDDLTNSTGYQLADFNSGSLSGNRRFYYAPSVAISRKGKLKIAIGSGYRAHPLAKGVQDRLYVFEDTNAARGAPESIPSIITESDMILTSNMSSDIATTSWYVNLAENEKALSEPLILNNNVTFTTYKPTFSGGGNVCDANGAQTQAYILELAKGKAVLSSGSNENAIQLESANIPSSPYLVFNAPTTTASENNNGVAPQSADMYIGTQKIGQIDQLNERMYWRKER